MKSIPEEHVAAVRRAAVSLALSPCNAILGALWRPMTAPELARITGLSITHVDRRRKEMLEAGQIQLTGKVREGHQEWMRAP